MADTNSISAMIGAFIAVAILIGLGPQILGNTVMDCTSLPGYVDGTVANDTGWAQTCDQGNAATQNAYSLLIIVLVVIAAVVILFVVKLL